MYLTKWSIFSSLEQYFYNNMYVRDKFFFFARSNQIVFKRSIYECHYLRNANAQSEPFFCIYMSWIYLGSHFFLYIKTKCTRKIDILAEIILQLVFFLRCNKFRRQSGIWWKKIFWGVITQLTEPLFDSDHDLGEMVEKNSVPIQRQNLVRYCTHP